MKAFRPLSLVFLLTIIFIFSAAHSQEDLVILDNSMFDNPQRPSVAFNHEQHNETAQIFECNICHHVYDNGELIEEESSEGTSCSECHMPEDVGRQPGLMKAYHLNCKGCHMEKKKGPVMCGECHQKDQG